MTQSAHPRPSWSSGARGGGAVAEALALLTLAWPLILTNLAQIAINTTEVLILGQLGPEALAAGGLGSSAFLVLVLICLGIPIAVAPMIGQAVGAGRHVVRETRRSFRQGLWTSAALALPAMLLLSQVDRLFALIGEDPALSAAATLYVHGALWGLPASLMGGVLRSLLSALGRPRAGLGINVAAIFVNIGLSWLLVVGAFGLPGWGVTGAGIAAALINWAMTLGILAFVLRDRTLRRYRLLGRWWRPDWVRFRELLRVGLPIGVALGFEVAVFSAASFAMGVIGTPSLAAHQIAAQCAFLTFMVPLGFAQAVSVRVAYGVGSGDPVMARRAGLSALAMGASFMACAGVVFWTATEKLVGLFLDRDAPGSAQVTELAVSFLRVAAIFQVVDALQAIGAGILRGLKDTRVPMLFAGLGYWGIAFPLGLYLAFERGFGGVGIWIGLATGLGVVSVMMLARCRWRLARLEA